MRSFGLQKLLGNFRSSTSDKTTLDIPLDENFVGIWRSTTTPLAFRLIPKCACSTISQILHFVDFGRFFDGNVHYDRFPLPQWERDKNDQNIRKAFLEKAYLFTFVRNPYHRLLSAYADKIVSCQYDGRYYRSGKPRRRLARYGANWGTRGDVAENFKKFVVFVADNIERNKPERPDIHWRPISRHLFETFSGNSRLKLDFVGHVECLQHDLVSVFEQAGVALDLLPNHLPRENASALPQLPFDRFYGEREIEIVQHVYKQDFELFGYPPDPGSSNAPGQVDVDRVNAAISSEARDHRG